MKSIFTPRKAFKPFEYPEITKFKDAIRQSYWVHDEWNFISDKHEFDIILNDVERSVVQNALLAISQIEVSVKTFWEDSGKRFPKPEFAQVGTTFSESEVRHADAYSHLLEELNLNDAFLLILNNPIIQGRVDYLQKYLKSASTNTNENYALTLTLFSMFIENVSLFSQFAIIKSFNKHKTILKDIDNVIQATQKEEIVHAQYGAYVINIIKEENPEWFNDEFYLKLYAASHKALDAETKIIDWIFEKGELSFLSKRAVQEFIKYRFNESLDMIGGQKIFTVDQEILKELEWFIDELVLETNVDFFYKKSVNYKKFSKSVNASDLFD